MEGSRDAVEQMLEKRVNAPLTSSAGRLFDAVAGLIGLRLRASFEGQAAMWLEQLARSVSAEAPYPFPFIAGQLDGIVDVVTAVELGEPSRCRELVVVAMLAQRGAAYRVRK